MRFIIIIFLLSIITGHSQSWIVTDILPPATRYDDIYFVSNDIGWAVNSGGGIYKTTDGGLDWKRVFQANSYLRSIEFINDSIGFAGSLQEKFLRTTDGGETWNSIQDSVPYSIDGICGLSHAGDHVFGVGVYNSPSYFIKSENKGVNWTSKDMSEYCDALVDCHFIDELNGFVSGADYDNGAIILKTTDGGETWNNVFSAPGTFCFAWKLFFVTPKVAYASLECPDGDFKIAKSVDGGNEWSLIHGPSGDYDIQGIGFESPSHGWVAPRKEGLYETYDGGMTWSPTNHQSNINRFFQVPGGRLYATGSQVYYYDHLTYISYSEIPVQSHNLSIHPNPYTTHFTIEAKLDMQTDVLIGMSELNGKKFFILYKGTLNEGLHTFNVDTQKFSIPENQALIVVLATDEGFLTEKIVGVK